MAETSRKTVFGPLGISRLISKIAISPTTRFAWLHLPVVSGWIPFASKYKNGDISLNMHPTALKMSSLTLCFPSLPLHCGLGNTRVSVAHHAVMVSKAILFSSVHGFMVSMVFLKHLVNAVRKIHAYLVEISSKAVSSESGFVDTSDFGTYLWKAAMT